MKFSNKKGREFNQLEIDIFYVLKYGLNYCTDFLVNLSKYYLGNVSYLYF